MSKWLSAPGTGLRLPTKNGTTHTFVLNVSYVDSLGGHRQMYTLMGDVPQGNFMLDGSNWVVRRCTCMAQRGGDNQTDGSWFGFDRATNPIGPNLAMPDFAYSAFIVAGPNISPVQVNSALAFADRTPPDENNIVLCGHDPLWEATNFDTYEGFNLGSTLARGTYNEPACLDLH